ncbi:MAG TPA: nuclear transport factor 2 family protein [Acidimicrobiales bacterium]|nr:nuclear transport factor 2 family protein [Acidimicrobiales bacterium]
MAAMDNDFETFVGICREAVAQQVSGRTGAFQALWSRDDDVVLIGAAGSHQKGWHDVSERLSWASQHLNFGGFHVENLLKSVSGDLAFTVDLEHMSREVGGEREQRTLRSSQGYRFEDGRWRVVFRHGDPMAEDALPREDSKH